MCEHMRKVLATCEQMWKHVNVSSDQSYRQNRLGKVMERLYFQLKTDRDLNNNFYMYSNKSHIYIYSSLFTNLTLTVEVYTLSDIHS